MKIKKGVVLLLCSLSIMCFAGCDSQDYKSALGLMESKQWSEARELFISLEDYKDSAAMMTECDYNIALEVMEGGDHDAAAELFETLSEYKDSADMASECRYLSASALMESGEYEAAIEKFTDLGDYKDSTELITECRYLHAVALYEGDDAEGALAIFETLEDYKDSNRYVVICSLLADPYGFVDEFSAAIDASYVREEIPYSLSANDSYGYDERSFKITGEQSSGNSSVYFTNITSKWSNYRNGQINGIIVTGTATLDEDDIVLTLLDVVCTAAVSLNLLDDSATVEDTAFMLNDEYQKLYIAGYPDTDAPVHFTEQDFDYNGYNCHLAISDLGGDYTRFVFAVSVPELVSE